MYYAHQASASEVCTKRIKAAPARHVLSAWPTKQREQGGKGWPGLDVSAHSEHDTESITQRG